MTNLENLICNKEKLAAILITSDEFLTTINNWWCNGGVCPFIGKCGETCIDETSEFDIAIEWLNSKYQNEEES